MEARERIRARIEEVATLYPEQRERLERCGDKVLELDNEMLAKSLDKQLQRIAGASTPQQAVKYIDKMEHALFESALFSPLLGARQEKKRQRVWITLGVAVALVLIIVGQFLYEAGQLF